MYVTSDLTELKMSPKGALFQAVDLWIDKDGRQHGSSQMNIVTQDIIFVPLNQIKDWNKDGKLSKTDGEELVEVTIQYYTNVPTVKTNPDTRDKYESGLLGNILFSYGLLRVAPTEKRLYNYLMRCSWNRDNADSKKNKLFFEVQADKKLLKEHDARKRKMVAMDLAETLELDELRKYGSSLGLSEDILNNEDLLRASMSARAEGDPEQFIKDSMSPELTMRAAINEAIQLQTLEMIPSTGEINRVTPAGRVLIIRSPKGKNQTDWFVDYLQNDNRGTLALIQQDVSNAVAKRNGEEEEAEIKSGRGNPNFGKKK
jgi:hypothetical protein